MTQTMRMPDEGTQLNAESRGREHSFTMRKTQRKNSRTSSRENKGEMQDIISEYKVGNYVDMKLQVEHRSHRDDGARACDESGTTRLGRWRDTPRQREAQAHERDEVQWLKHAPRSDSQAQQPDLTISTTSKVAQRCFQDFIGYSVSSGGVWTGT